MIIPVLKAAYKALSETEPKEPIGSVEFYEKLAISMLLVLAGGVFAGYVTQRPVSRLKDLSVVFN